MAGNGRRYRSGLAATPWPDARAWGWPGCARAAGAAAARSVSTWASFQARLSASRSPPARPWPMNGGVRWAASPSRKIRPAAEAGCHLGAEGVGRGADDLQAVQVAAPGPGPQQLAEGGRGDQAGFVLAVAQPELPAVPVAGDLHEGGGAGGVADLLHAVPGVQAGPGLDVDHEPAFGEAQVVHGDPGQLADGAVGAVAAQHDRPGERLRVPGDAGVHPDWPHGPRGVAGDRAGGAVQPGYLGAAAEVDQRVPLDPGEHQLFQVGLVEHVRLREPVLAGLVARG